MAPGSRPCQPPTLAGGAPRPLPASNVTAIMVVALSAVGDRGAAGGRRRHYGAFSEIFSIGVSTCSSATSRSCPAEPQNCPAAPLSRRSQGKVGCRNTRHLRLYAGPPTAN